MPKRSLIKMCISYVGLSLASMTHAQPLMIESLLQYSPSIDAPQYRPNITDVFTNPSNLTQFIGAPTVVYLWQAQCGPCARELIHLNRLAATHPQVVTILIGNNPPTHILKGLTQLDNITHFYAPYFNGELQQDSELRILNSAGEQAAVYPDLQQWQRVKQLLSELNSMEQAQYSSNTRLEPKYNPLRLDQLSTTSSGLWDTGLELSFRPIGGAGFESQFHPHHLQLDESHVSADVIYQAGRESSPNYKGIELDYQQDLRLDRSVGAHVSALGASDYETQAVAPEIDKPKMHSFSLNYQSYINETLVRVDLFQQKLAYRSDQGFSGEASTLLWNDRSLITLGGKFWQASHDASTTVTQQEDDRNRIHFLHMSHRINADQRFLFRWANEGLQGIIAEPDETVYFVQGATAAQQYALYPTTRTLNRYALQWEQKIKTNLLQLGIGYLEDTWEIEQIRLFSGLTHQWNTVELYSWASLTKQNGAVFFSNLFPIVNAQNLMTRNPDLASFDSIATGINGVLPLKQNWADKPIALTFGLALEYTNFETLSQPSGAFESPLSQLSIQSALGFLMTL